MMRSAGLALVGFMLATAASAAPSISVEHAWARPTSPAAKVGVAYFTIHNPGAADTLVSASTPVASTATLHEATHQGTVAGMREVANVPVPAGGSLAFRPGGYHLMLMGLKGPLLKGQTFPLTLTFAKAGKVETTVAIGAGSGEPAGGTHAMGAMPGMTH